MTLPLSGCHLSSSNHESEHTAVANPGLNNLQNPLPPLLSNSERAISIESTTLPIFPPTSFQPATAPNPTLFSDQLSALATTALLLALAARDLAASNSQGDKDDFEGDVDRVVGLDQAEKYRKKYKEADSKLRMTRLLLSASSSTSRLQCTLIDILKGLLVQHNIEIPPQLASLTAAVRPLSLPSTA